jgi:hypothetical protein
VVRLLTDHTVGRLNSGEVPNKGLIMREERPAEHALKQAERVPIIQ